MPFSLATYAKCRLATQLNSRKIRLGCTGHPDYRHEKQKMCTCRCKSANNSDLRVLCWLATTFSLPVREYCSLSLDRIDLSSGNQDGKGDVDEPEANEDSACDLLGEFWSPQFTA